MTGGLNIGPTLYSRDSVAGLGAQFRRVVEQIVGDFELIAGVGGRFGWKRLGRRGLLTRNVGLRNGTLLDRPDRLARHAIENIQEGFLARQRDGFDGLSVDVDVRKDWG